ALSAMDGSVIGKFKTGDMVRSKPAVNEEHLYAGSWDHFMYALNKEDGSLIWKYDAGQRIQSSPLVLEDKVIFGSRAASVFALNKKTGKEVWKNRYWGSWVESSPVVFDNTIYIGSSEIRKVYALDPSDGKALMYVYVEGWAWLTVAVTKDYIYTGSTGSLGYAENMHGKFYAFERKTGKPVWQFKVAETDKVFAYGFASSPTLWKKWVFVGGLDGNMYGLKVK
ncbi:MAG: PQQ-binding-like beta-propeller repeat protein, partial [Cyclobacteriaceae bacterium]|nr:PQQ-binding-like beta-propeller repeat protein [Cyclobacteriaceae bacterium]